MNDSNTSTLKEKYKSWSNDELLRGVVCREDYLPEAIEAMQDELARRNISIGEKEILTNTIVKEKDLNEKKFSGVKGFLLFFVIYLCWFSLGSTIVSIKAIIEYMDDTIISITSILQILISIYGFYVFFLLVLRKSNAVKITRIYLSILFLFSVISLIVLSSFNYNVGIPGLGALIWLVYFIFSKRVALTYKLTS